MLIQCSRMNAVHFTRLAPFTPLNPLRNSVKFGQERCTQVTRRYRCLSIHTNKTSLLFIVQTDILVPPSMFQSTRRHNTDYQREMIIRRYFEYLNRRGTEAIRAQDRKSQRGAQTEVQTAKEPSVKGLASSTATTTVGSNNYQRF